MNRKILNDHSNVNFKEKATGPRQKVIVNYQRLKIRKCCWSRVHNATVFLAKISRNKEKNVHASKVKCVRVKLKLTAVLLSIFLAQPRNPNQLFSNYHLQCCATTSVQHIQPCSDNWDNIPSDREPLGPLIVNLSSDPPNE